MSIAVSLICGVVLAGCGAMGVSEEASKPKPELTTVAGDGGSKLGDGGPATKAGLCGPTDVTLDAEGNMYISDTGEYCIGPGGDSIRKVDPDGTITTFAGTGEAGHSGDGGPATFAQLREPDQMTFDARGNLYVGDFTSVRKIDPSGTITTVAGTGRFGFSGDGGPATEAKLTASDVALDDKGNLYISDTEHHRIRMVNKDGIIHTVAGTGKEGYSGDGGPATKAALNLPIGIALDEVGNLFIACHHNSRVRKVDRNGKITTVAGTGEWMFNREKGPATKVALNQPWGLFFDEDSGVLYIADAFNSRIRALRLEGS
jgi:NHL repeat